MTYRIDPAIENPVLGDADRIRQVLVNLLGNAIKFTKSGTVELSVRLRPEEATNTHQRVEFEVMDTGIGLPSDKIDSLFEAFTQADMSSTRSYGGTGLGLAISKQLVELMGGKIWCRNNAPRGCSFFFTVELESVSSVMLPIQKGQPNGKHQDRSDKKPKRKRRLNILLAEDSQVNQKLMMAVLGKWGHDVMVARNGAEAVELWASRNHNFDLVLMDVLMPELDGKAAASQIRQGEQELGEHIPIIALTAQVLEGDRQACLDAGMDDYIGKPISYNILEEMIERWCY